MMDIAVLNSSRLYGDVHRDGLETLYARENPTILVTPGSMSDSAATILD